MPSQRSKEKKARRKEKAKKKNQKNSTEYGWKTFLNGSDEEEGLSEKTLSKGSGDRKGLFEIPDWMPPYLRKKQGVVNNL